MKQKHTHTYTQTYKKYTFKTCIVFNLKKKTKSNIKKIKNKYKLYAHKNLKKLYL